MRKKDFYSNIRPANDWLLVFLSGFNNNRMENNINTLTKPTLSPPPSSSFTLNV